MSKLKLVSLNCRGLQDSKKRKDVFKYIRESNASVYCLQDTHCTDEDENAVYSQWGFDILCSPGKTDSRGTLTLFNNNIEYKLSKVKVDSCGNYIISKILFANKYCITLVNLYGPNKDNPEFFTEISNIIEEFESEFIIMCGDWNLVQNFGLDCYNYVKENNIKSKSEVEALKSKFNLIDPWRTYNPNDKMYTWQRRNPIKQARLDSF